YIQTAAESSTLERESVNGLFCMQAFHWLNREAVRQEFLRILKPMAKIFIAGKFLSPINEATAQYLQITRFGKRLYGMSDNREAYTPEVMEAIFGHPVKKQTVCRESEYKTLDQLKALIQLRIDSSGDEDIKSNTGYIQEQAERFFHQYADSNNTVTLISETIFYCGPLS
ncbi:MAG: hypothetical protein LBT14_14470, partial [Treponema sp.]|nr:hypothetical protein [Treponema sp.]